MSNAALGSLSMVSVPLERTSIPEPNVSKFIITAEGDVGSSLANDSRTFIVREINILQGEFCIGFDGDLQVLWLSVTLEDGLSANGKGCAIVGAEVYFGRCLFYGDGYRIKSRHYRGEGCGKGGFDAIHLYTVYHYIGHYVGLPALGVAVSLFLHLYPALRGAAIDNGSAFIVRAGGAAVDFHALRQRGLRAVALWQAGA